MRRAVSLMDSLVATNGLQARYAGLTGYRAELQKSCDMTIVDPVETGCRMLQATVEPGLKVSRTGLYRRPAAQRVNGLERPFQQEMAEQLRSWEDDR